MPTVHDFSAVALDGKTCNLADYKGRWLLIVNVASKCGFTPQYEGLEALWKQYQPRGLTVLGFPCNQFGHQEPGTADDIRTFCSMNYGVSFPLFAKIDVNGDGAHPLYRFLKHAQPGVLGTEAVKWNFTKFLVDPAGAVVKRYASKDTPADIGKDLEKRLAA
ncbi:MAG: glutathione peroxidase [Nevskiaceae bacterium]|nr:MAG: glutathione peroxidase [Nevskiaceae bacterium]TBR73682.1 MAG: glutathione peroxidase [Nevskiaceae bacterium]